jgi:hypothetical protein
MSERVFYDPEIPVWVMPDDENDLVPLPALLASETEHEAVLHEYDRRKKQFSLEPVERRVKAYPHFNECRFAMLQQRADILYRVRREASKQAAIYNHILSVDISPFPEDAATGFRAQQVQRQEKAEAQVEADEEVKPAKRHARRR